MAQRSSRKRRKGREAGADATAANAEAGAGAESGEHEQMARGYARGRAKDEAARAALQPLAEGERPPAVTVAGAVALVLGTANIVAYLSGVEISGERPQPIGVLIYSGLMFAATWGCFKVRYWAVLGMQALLGLAVVIFSLLLIRAESIVALAIAVAVIGGAGTLFWFLVKSMARIQMPERPGE
ncbi:MAG: hypothetical protein M3131_10680 [Actinomycetota bacterium]|nr:hypothetical protein [Actinomycetota bacterium]